MTDIAIRVEKLGKHYRIGGKQERYKRFTESLTDTLTAPIRRAKQALQRAGAPDVSFEVQRGEATDIAGGHDVRGE